jgi:hypothetical protein
MPKPGHPENCPECGSDGPRRAGYAALSKEMQGEMNKVGLAKRFGVDLVPYAKQKLETYQADPRKR